MCTVQGTPAAQSISWTRSGVSIAIDNSKYTCGNTANPSLTINNFQSSDAGSYVCSASTAVGTSTSGVSSLTYGGSKDLIGGRSSFATPVTVYKKMVRKKTKNIIKLHGFLNCCLSIRFPDVNSIYPSNRQILQSRHYMKPMKYLFPLFENWDILI